MNEIAGVLDVDKCGDHAETPRGFGVEVRPGSKSRAKAQRDRKELGRSVRCILGTNHREGVDRKRSIQAFRCRLSQRDERKEKPLQGPIMRANAKHYGNGGSLNRPVVPDKAGEGVPSEPVIREGDGRRRELMSGKRERYPETVTVNTQHHQIA